LPWAGGVIVLSLAAILLAGPAAGAGPATPGVEKPESPSGGIVDERVESVSLGDIHVEDGRLWVDVKDMPAPELFAEIGAAAGFEARVDRAYGERKITVRFSRVPIERALSRLVRLLDTKNFRVNYGPDGTISRLEVYKPELGGVSAVATKKTPRSKTQKVSRPTRRQVSASRSRRAPVRRRIPSRAEYRDDEEFDEWYGEEAAEENQDEFVDDEELDRGEDVPFVEPVGEVQKFR